MKISAFKSILDTCAAQDDTSSKQTLEKLATFYQALPNKEVDRDLDDNELFRIAEFIYTRDGVALEVEFRDFIVDFSVAFGSGDILRDFFGKGKWSHWTNQFISASVHPAALLKLLYSIRHLLNFMDDQTFDALLACQVPDEARRLIEVVKSRISYPLTMEQLSLVLCTKIDELNNLIMLDALRIALIDNHDVFKKLVGTSENDDSITLIRDPMFLERFILQNRYLTDNQDKMNLALFCFRLACEKGLLTERFTAAFASCKDKTPEQIFADFSNYPDLIFQMMLYDEKDELAIPRVLFFEKLHAILQQPVLVKRLSDLLRLESIHFYDSGRSVDRWWMMAHEVLIRTPISKLSNQDSKDKRKKIDDDTHDDVVVSLDQINFEQFCLKTNNVFLRLQGRTVLLINGEHILAVKVNKRDETLSELRQEYKTNLHYKQQAQNLSLQSYIPEPVSLSNTSGIIAWLKGRVSENSLNQFVSMVGSKSEHLCYIYKVDFAHDDYFTYLHDLTISDEQFTRANRAAVSDLCQLLAHGRFYPQTADIFHNSEKVKERADKGRYIVFANLLSTMSIVHKLPSGTGRLTGWKKAVEYPNIRATGLADFGDWASLNDCRQGGSFSKAFFSSVENIFDQSAGEFIIANILAEYQYVLLLIAGRRASALSKHLDREADADAITDIWSRVANQIVSNCALMMSTLLARPEAEMQRLITAAVHVDRLAAQMHFWMTDEYIQYVNINQLPSELYGKDVKVKVSSEKFRRDTFDINRGFMINGVDPDLGPVNGQEPIKEANKLFYWMVTFIFSAYNEFELTYSTMAKYKKTGELDPVNAFKHLPKNKYHAMMFALAEKQQENPQITASQQQYLQTYKEDQKRKWAGHTILNFLRNHSGNSAKKQEVTSNEMDVENNERQFKR